VADSAAIVAEPHHVSRHVEPVHDDQLIPSAAALWYQHDDDAQWLVAKQQPFHESDLAVATAIAIQLQYKHHGDAAIAPSDDEPYDVIAAIPPTVAAAAEVEFHYKHQQPLG